MSGQLVIHLDAGDIIDLATWLTGARSARLMIDEGGIKVSADRGVWSYRPLGQIGYPEVQS